MAASLGLLLFGIYMIGFDGTLHSTDGLSMFAVAENIIKHNQFDTRQLLSWGNVVLGIDNLPYTIFPIGLSLLMLPFVALSLALPHLGSVQTTLVLMPLSGALTAIYVCLISRRLGYSRNVAILTALLVGLTTMIWPRTRDLVADPLMLLSFTATFYHTLAFRQDQELKQAALVGAFLSLTVLLKVINIFAAPLFFWYMAVPQNDVFSLRRINWRSMLVAGIIWSFSILMIGVYNMYRFGSPLETGYGYPRAFSTPTWIGALGYLVSPYKSIFLYVPLFILIPFTIWRAWKCHRRETILTLLLVTASMLIHGSWFDWGGGRTWGPRFLVPLNGLLTLLLLPFIKQAVQGHEWRHKIVLFIFSMLSILLQVIGISARDYVYLDANDYWRPLPNFSYFGELTPDDPSQWPIWGHLQKFNLGDIPVIWRWEWEGLTYFDPVSLLAVVFIAFLGFLAVLISVRHDEPAWWPSGLWLIVIGCVFLILFRNYDDPRSIKRAHEGAEVYPAYSNLLSQLPDIVDPDDTIIFTDRRFEFYLLDKDKTFASRYIIGEDGEPIILETVPKLLQQAPKGSRIWLVTDDLDNRLLAYSTELWLKERAQISERYLFGQSVQLVGYSPSPTSLWEPIPPEPQLDRVVKPKEYTFKGIAALLGWDWPEIEADDSPLLEARKSYDVDLYWVYLGMSSEDTFYVRLIDEQGRIAVEALPFPQPDSPLIPGQLFVDDMTVSLPGDLPPGSYRLQIGFFTRAVEAGELNFSLPDEMVRVQVRR